MGLKSKLVGTALLSGTALFSGCDYMFGPVEIDLLPASDITGRVVWDLDKDGNYEPSPGAAVTLDNGGYFIDGNNGYENGGGGLSCKNNPGECAITDSEGRFTLKKVSKGEHDLYVLNLSNAEIINGYPPYSAEDTIKHSGFNALDIGDILLEETNVIRDETGRGVSLSEFLNSNPL